MAASSSRVRSLVPLGYLIVGIAWVLGSDVLLGRATSLDLTAQLLGSAKGVAFVVLSAVLIHVVQAWPAAPVAEPDELRRSAGWTTPVAIFLLTSVGVVLAAYVAYVQQSAEVRRRAADGIVHSAELTARQVQLRLADWQAALDASGRNPLVADALRAAIDSSDGDAAQRLQAGLEVLRLSDDFERVQSFDLQLRPVADSGGPIRATDSLRLLVDEARDSGRVVSSDVRLQRGDVRAEPTMDFVVTVGDPLSPGEPVGVIVARADIGQQLFPLIEDVVDQSPTVKFSLARRDDERVRLLRPTPGRRTAPGSFSYVAAKPGTSAAEVFAGRRGALETLDVAGHAVLAVGRPISGTPWVLIAEVNRDAVDAPLHRVVRLVLMLGCAALACSALLISLWWRNERRALGRRIEAAEQRTLLLKEHFSLAGRLVHDIVLLLDASDGRVVEANDRALEAYGYTAEEIVGKTVFELRPQDPTELAAAKARFERLRVIAGATYTTEHWRKDGTAFPVEVSARPCTIEGHQYVQAIVRDISERVEQERRLATVAAERDRLVDRLNLQFERMASACIVIDGAGRIAQINPSFERTFGWKPGLAVGKPFGEVVLTPSFGEEMAARAAMLKASPEEVYTGVHENRTVAGRPIVCRWTATALFEGNEVHGIIAMAEDITEQIEAERALRASEERYRTLTEISPVGIFRTDVKGATVFINQRSCAITGLSPEASLGYGWAQAIHAGDAGVVGAGWFSYLKSGGSVPYDAEFRIIRPDHSVAWVLAQVRPEHDGRGMVVGHVGTLTDVTALKDAQRALEESRDHLEDRVAQRTSELEAAKNAAEHSDRVKSAFLSTMSHELRTPLNSILGFTDVLLHGLSGPLTEAQRRQLEIVRDSSTHLRALIEDVLDISRIEAGQVGLEYTSLDLRELLERRIEGFGAEASRKGVTLDLRLPATLPTVRCDHKRAGQIVNNLVSNALKFTDRGHVTVAVRVEDDDVFVDVVDTGVGIEAEALRTLFNPFTQVRRPGGRLHEGTGLGLAISRNLARAMGGDVFATSVVGEGSRFTWRHPLEPVERRQAGTTGTYRRPAVADTVEHY